MRLRETAIILGILVGLSTGFCPPASCMGWRNFPPDVEAFAGAKTTPAGRPWNLPSWCSGRNCSISLPDPAGELKPHPLPSPGAELPPSEDPAREKLKDGFKALGKGDMEEALFSFAQGAKGVAGSPFSDACAFWLGETRRRTGKTGEAIAAFAQVRGEMIPHALYRRARLAESLGRGAEALKMWEALDALAENPYRAETNHRLGMADYRAGKLEAATARLMKAVESAGPSSELLPSYAYLLGLLLRESGRGADAAPLLAAAILASPNHPASSASGLLLGWIEVEKGDFQAAKERFAPYLRSPAVPEALAMRALYGMSRVYAGEGDFEAHAKAVAQLALDASGPWAGWASADAGAALLEKRRYEEALAAYRQAFALWKGEGRWAPDCGVGEALIRQGRMKEAVAHLKGISGDFEGLPAVWVSGAIEMHFNGFNEEALVLLELVFERYPDYQGIDTARLIAGFAHWQAGRLAKAVEYVEMTGEKTEGREILHYLKGLVAFEAGRWDEASASMEKFLALGGNGREGDDARLKLAKAYEKSGRGERAAEALLEYSKVAADRALARKAEYEAALLLAAGKNPQNGASLLEKLLKDERDMDVAAKAHENLGQIYAKMGAHAQALTHFTAQRSLAGDSAAALKADRAQAAALSALGRHAEALDLYGRLPEDAETARGAALAARGSGDPAAMARWSKSLKNLSPGDPLAAELEFSLGGALSAAGDRAGAAAAYRAASGGLAGERRERARCLLAVELDALGFSAEAEALAGELADGAADPEIKIQAARLKARFEAAAGRVNEAAMRLKSLLEKEGPGHPRRAALLNDLGEALLSAGDSQGAIVALRSASPLAEGDEALRNAKLMGEALLKSGQRSAALESYLRIVNKYKLDKDDAADSALRAASILSARGEKAEAEALLERVRDSASPARREKAAKALAESRYPAGLDPEMENYVP